MNHREEQLQAGYKRGAIELISVINSAEKLKRLHSLIFAIVKYNDEPAKDDYLSLCADMIARKNHNELKELYYILLGMQGQNKSGHACQ